MFQLQTILLLALLAPLGISIVIQKESELQENYKRIEIIVQKYKALRASELKGIENERYNFRFCACEHEAAKPEKSSSCSCSEVVSGKTTYNSLPQALYSSKCVHSPDQNECLIAKIKAKTTQNLLYVKMMIGLQLLTVPPYHSIANSKFRKTAFLSCSKDTHCRNCIPCKSGLVQLNYITLSNILAVESKQPYSSVSLRSNKKERFLAKTFKKLPSTEINKDDFNNTTKIKEQLLESDKKQHSVDSQFNINIFKDALVKQHNIYRKKHGVGPLEANGELDQLTESWAQSLASREGCLMHDPSRRYGENIFFYASNSLPSEETLAEMTARSFYLESRGYDYKMHKSLDNHPTGHFTQLIWKSTKQIGIGIAMRQFNGLRTNKCQPTFPATMVYVVIKYDPPGNVCAKKIFDDNVLPPIL